MSRPVTAALLSLVLAACSTGPTAYKPSDGYEGYGSERLETDRFRVTFAGNTLTDRERVADYLLYRAAELTLEQGGDWFVVVDREVEPRTRYWVRLNAFDYMYGTVHRHHLGGFGPVLDGGADPITRYDAWAEIRVYSGRKPDTDPRAYDARAVLAELGPRVVRPRGG